MKKIDLQSWKRKEHYEFFEQFDEPFFSFTANVDCGDSYNYAKKNGLSFFALYLFESLVAVNQIPEFRLRIVDDEVIEYEAIHASSTIGRTDGTFGFSFISFNGDFAVFLKELKAEISAVAACDGLRFTENMMRADVIHFSAIPWIQFTALSHPRNFKRRDSVPKITFGKVIHENNKALLPVGVHAHHGLMDGIHVGRFLELFEQGLQKYR